MHFKLGVAKHKQNIHIKIYFNLGQKSENQWDDSRSLVFSSLKHTREEKIGAWDPSSTVPHLFSHQVFVLVCLNVALKQPEPSSSLWKYLHTLLALDSLLTRSSSLLANHDLGPQVGRDSSLHPPFRGMEGGRGGLLQPVTNCVTMMSLTPGDFLNQGPGEGREQIRQQSLRKTRYFQVSLLALLLLSPFACCFTCFVFISIYPRLRPFTLSARSAYPHLLCFCNQRHLVAINSSPHRIQVQLLQDCLTV